MDFFRMFGFRTAFVSSFLFLSLSSLSIRAQMVTGSAMPGFAETFRLSNESSFEVVQTGVKSETGSGVNVLWPGETGTFTFLLRNKTGKPIQTSGSVEVVHYGTRGRIGDIWVPQVFGFEDRSIPSHLDIEIPAGGTVELTLSPPIPEVFGGYALVFDLGSFGRVFGASLVRSIQPDLGRVQYPTFALDLPWPHEMRPEVMQFFKRVGVKGARHEVSAFALDGGDFDKRWSELKERLNWMYENDISVMLFPGASTFPQPLGRPRPHLTENNEFRDTKSDMAWLPEYDDEFQAWVKKVTGTFGWPKGPVNAMELWNEPWEGISISGWGADMLRYREIFSSMARGIEQARREDGVQVLIGGACSSSNTLDKFFGDGGDEFLKWLDFCSIHYQPLSAAPALIKSWQERKSPYGPVRTWDTESWVANSEDRVGVVIASMRAQGQSRTVGIFSGNVYEPVIHKIDGQERSLIQAWSPAAAVAALQKFIGQRDFQKILFQNGLPWVFVFDGRDAGGQTSPDDGTVVVVGDLRDVYEPDQVLFRSVHGLSNRPRLDALREQLASTTNSSERETLRKELRKAGILSDGHMIVPNPDGHIVLFDFQGNPIQTQSDSIEVPLNHLGYYLRTDGTPGSFAAMLEALKTARISGYEPLDIVAHDLTAPLDSAPTLRLSLTNILNRPVKGSLSVKLGDSSWEMPLEIGAHATQDAVMAVTGLASRPDNTYPLSVRFDAGSDGAAVHQENLHVNVIARRTVAVDGNLEDWENVLPQPVEGQGIGASLTEQAWLPFQSFDSSVEGGFSTGYLAYDDEYFYFAAKIADRTPDEGNLRFETRDEDAPFYPEKSIAREVNRQTGEVKKTEELTWPEGVRRFSYRKDLELPDGTVPDHDNVQIAFNAVPLEEEPWLQSPPGAMPRFMCYRCTDYEYALNKVANEFGGGVEIWRLLAPGMPRKHFYARQPKSPQDGPVKNGRLEIVHDGSTRVVEAALPWSEIPRVKQCLDEGRTVKFSFRVNDNRGPAHELAAGRSISKINFPAFHADWITHWANELEFGFEK